MVCWSWVELQCMADEYSSSSISPIGIPGIARSCAYPTTEFSGVRIAWFIEAMKPSLVRAAVMMRLVSAYMASKCFWLSMFTITPLLRTPSSSGDFPTFIRSSYQWYGLPSMEM